MEKNVNEVEKNENYYERRIHVSIYNWKSSLTKKCPKKKKGYEEEENTKKNGLR